MSIHDTLLKVTIEDDEKVYKIFLLSLSNSCYNSYYTSGESWLQEMWFKRTKIIVLKTPMNEERKL